jgi:P27 family predicted phage terminase small subunit
MRGSHSKIKNVVPMRPDGVADEATRKAATARRVRELMPKGLDDDCRKEWRRVATMLADPTVNRLKVQYVDMIKSYCIATVRLHRFRTLFDELAKEIYQIKGRNGLQVKSHPHIGQMNETWRQWYAMAKELGLSPVAERSLIGNSQQGDFGFENEDFYS